MRCSEESTADLLRTLNNIEQELQKTDASKQDLLSMVSRLKTDVKELCSDRSMLLNAEDMQSKYEFIVNNAKEFMSLIDRDYKYIAVNDSYCFAQNKTRSEIIGKSLSDLWGSAVFKNTIKEYIDDCFTGKEIRYEEWFEFPALGKRYFDVRYYPYYDHNAEVSHVVVITHDITQRKNAEINLKKHQNHLEEMVNERTLKLEEINQKLQSEIVERKQLEERQARLIEDLKVALQNVKRLQGLIPICASCKKMRDDKGYWEDVEAYIKDHSDVEFTHGICPDCMKELYPDFVPKQQSSVEADKGPEK